VQPAAAAPASDLEVKKEARAARFGLPVRLPLFAWRTRRAHLRPCQTSSFCFPPLRSLVQLRGLNSGLAQDPSAEAAKKAARAARFGPIEPAPEQLAKKQKQ